MNATIKIRDFDLCFKLPLYLTTGSIFFNDDIVEILNVSRHNITSIQSQTCSNSNPAPYIIGNKYKLKMWAMKELKNYHYGMNHEKFIKDIHDQNKLKAELKYEMHGWNHGGHAIFFNAEELRLYYRPIKNWLKYIWLILFKIYYL